MATVSTGPHITDETSVDQSFMDTTIMHRQNCMVNTQSRWTVPLLTFDVLDELPPGGKVSTAPGVLSLQGSPVVIPTPSQLHRYNT